MPADVAIDALVAAVRRRLRRRAHRPRYDAANAGCGAAARARRASASSRRSFARLSTRRSSRCSRASIPRLTRHGERGHGLGEPAERMHFIADLFRSWHGRTELYTAPYTAAQVAAMREGQRPAGDL